MRPKELIDAMGPILGVPHYELVTVDRSLTLAGLRAKARGRTFPHVTRAEAVRLLLGVALDGNRTQAGEAVRAREAFALFPMIAPDAPRLAELLGFAPTVGMGLVEAIGRVCGHLASGGAAGVFVAVEVTDGPISIVVDDHDDTAPFRAELQFSGVLAYAGHPGLETVRTIRPHVLRWIGENTAA